MVLNNTFQPRAKRLGDDRGFEAMFLPRPTGSRLAWVASDVVRPVLCRHIAPSSLTPPLECANGRSEASTPSEERALYKLGWAVHIAFTCVLLQNLSDRRYPVHDRPKVVCHYYPTSRLLFHTLVSLIPPKRSSFSRVDRACLAVKSRQACQDGHRHILPLYSDRIKYESSGLGKLPRICRHTSQPRNGRLWRFQILHHI